MPICTLEQVKADLEITDSSKDDVITRLIGAVTDFVERKTRRQLSLISENRRFDGTNKGYIQTDDFIEIGQIDVVEVTGQILISYPPAAYRYFPLNGYPRYRVDLINAVSENPYRVLGRSPYTFPRGPGNVVMSGVWGSWPTIPPALEDFGINLVKSRLAKRKTRGYQSASIGGESVTISEKDLDEGMLEVINQFKKPPVYVW